MDDTDPETAMRKWDDEMLAVLAERFKALAHPLRVKIVEVLLDGPSSVNRLAEEVGAPQAVVSQHLQKLWASGFVRRSRHGTRVVYRVIGDDLSLLLECVRGCLLVKSDTEDERDDEE
ncbi:MAG: transcriptional regulator [Planctomycetota bacterium]|nr:MAG: transcriptional regulator [Planctomycetota bacterium]